MIEIVKRGIISAGLALMMSGIANAEVTITQGKTLIPDGEANHVKDLTVQNEKLAFALAIESAAPWGVPRGALVDLSVVTNGRIEGDKIAFADFIPNSWSAWPNDGKVVEIIENAPQRATIKIRRNFAAVDITTWYSLAAGDDQITLKTVMRNNGENTLSLTSGFTLWADAGQMFEVPGLNEEKFRHSKTLSDRIVGYDRDWAFALHAPYFDRNTYGGRDMYKAHTLKPGAQQTFEAALQVVPDGDLAPVVKAEAARRGEATGALHGRVTAQNGNVPDNAMVIVRRQNHLYAWTLATNGNYQIDLPVGEYEVFGTASGHADSPVQKVTVTADSDQSYHFTDLALPGELVLKVEDADTAAPLDARISIAEGQEPLVAYLGRQTFFTELTPVGQAKVALAPGQYTINIDAGAGFERPMQHLEVTLTSGKVSEYKVKIASLTDTAEHQWYGADLHHHGNVLEATTPPETVVRSQLAAGLDLTFISEHDSIVNFAEFAALSAQRKVPFIPSIEVSPSWGHMNPFPIGLDATFNADSGTDDIHTLVKAMEDMGAVVIPMNHPYNDFGYYTNLAKNEVTGGATDAFRLLEINIATNNAPTLAQLHRLWDGRKPVYMTAGTDTHDAWSQRSGAIRMLAHVSESLTPQSYAQALKAGHSYASTGPLIYPHRVNFGDTTHAGQTWPVDVVAVNGLKEVRLIGQGGKVLHTVSFDNQPLSQHQRVILPIPAEAQDWVSIEVDDQAGKKAWSNPLWLTVN